MAFSTSQNLYAEFKCGQMKDSQVHGQNGIHSLWYLRLICVNRSFDAEWNVAEPFRMGITVQEHYRLDSMFCCFRWLINILYVTRLFAQSSLLNLWHIARQR